MTGSVSRRMGLLLVLCSGIFFFHPVVAYVDVLPNCIGCLLLYIGLGRLSDLNGRIHDARRRFGILILLGLLQVLTAVLIYRMPALLGEEKMNAYEQSVYLLLGSFVMAFIDCWFLIPAFRDLLSGLGTLAERHNVEGLTAEKKGKTPAAALSTRISVYVVLSSFLSLLPELTILTSFEHDVENQAFPFDWYDFVRLFRIGCGFLCGILSLICLIAFVRFFVLLLREKEFLSELRTGYIDKILPQTGMLTVRRFSAAFLLLQIGIVFAVNLRLNFYNVLPGAVLALLVSVALASCVRGTGLYKATVAASLLLGAVSVLQFFFNAAYLKQYSSTEDAAKLPEAYRLFFPVQILEALEALLSLVLIALLLRALYSVVQNHTGVDYGAHDSGQLSAVATAQLHAGFRRRLLVILAVFALAGVLYIAEAFLQLDYPWFWLVSFGISFVGICLFYSFLNELKTQIQFHYRSDGTNKTL